MHCIDSLQFANWSEKIFLQMREGGVDAIHVTIAYHEMFRDMVANLDIRFILCFLVLLNLEISGLTGLHLAAAKVTPKPRPSLACLYLTP